MECGNPKRSSDAQQAALRQRMFNAAVDIAVIAATADGERSRVDRIAGILMVIVERELREERLRVSRATSDE